ncbi:AzlC family ABC transporter permease [Mechercharimyces sp. CAU 1602]|uniref:AzlC family ABC transporter permease n=1 Tax=Mechercharimyces sp. CAU 1602 TaxID=2973933 RepID=UPI002163B454|nr:AzlC family ABC transporter permease [Mechercharimyces sp. CAU 1602]MCS1350394.1 AzlC family ABC transporter permease [Mechercharimyces sp. CAU 1602]
MERADSLILQQEQPTFIQGVIAGLPIVIGYFPVAITFGVLAQQMGVSVSHAFLMSSLVFAGASQFMALNMLALGTGALEIVLATFILNFRHFVMGLALMNQLEKLSRKWKLTLSLALTDEVFTVTSFNQERATPSYIAGLTGSSYLAWVGGTVVGALVSHIIPAGISESMSIALYAMFIALLVPAVRTCWHYGVIALISMAINTLIGMWLSSGWSIVIATLVGALAGVPLMRRRKG